MKVGDLVYVKGRDGPDKNGAIVWNEFMGATGVIIAEAMRLHIPAFKVMLIDEVVEFDHDELELAK